MLRRSLDESAGHFWQPEKFENVANPDFENLKHLQNPAYLLMTKPSICAELYTNKLGMDTVKIRFSLAGLNLIYAICNFCSTHLHYDCAIG